MVKAALLAAIVLSLGHLAAAGTVQTRDGRTLIGALKFDGDAISITPAQGSAVTVPLGEVASAVFPDPLAIQPSVSDKLLGRDVGEVARPGQSTITDERITIVDGGRALADATGRRDSFHFLCRALPGDGMIVGRLRQYGDAAGSCAGLMIRQGLAAESPYVMVYRGPGGRGIMVERRQSGGAIKVVGEAEMRIIGAAWLKLSRRGHTISGYESIDGSTWNELGRCRVPPEQGASIGLAAAQAGKVLFDRVQVVVEPASSPMPVGVVTRGGSTIAAEIVEASGDDVTIARAGGEKQVLSTADLSRIVFAPISRGDEGTAPAQACVMLAGGDFMEGEFRGIEQGKVKLSSVLFGLKRLEIKREVMEVLLRPPAVERGAWEVTLGDGSVLRAKAIVVEGGELVIDETAVGKIRVKAGEVIELRTMPGSPNPAK